MFQNQPTQTGQLLNIPANNENLAQLWVDHPTGRLYYRGGDRLNSITNTPFKRFLDTDDLSAAGVVAGDVSNADAWWVKLGGAVPLIIQGGYNKVQTTVQFPVAFKSIAYSVVATLAKGDEEAAQTWSYTATDFYLYEKYSQLYGNPFGFDAEVFVIFTFESCVYQL